MKLLAATIIFITSLTGASDVSAQRDIIIVHKSLPIVYFGMYRTSQMQGDGWTLFDRSTDWADGFIAPADLRVWLATYNGTLDNQYSAEKDGIAVYNHLLARGVKAANIHVSHQSGIETGDFTGYDIVIYAWSYPRNAQNVLDQNKPFVTCSAGETDELGIGTGVETMHESRDYAYVVDNGHDISSPFSLGLFTLPQPMFMDATEVAGEGRVLLTADPSPDEVYHPTSAETLRGTYNSGNVASLAADDDDYWLQGAEYNPSDPLAVIDSTLGVATQVASASYSSGTASAVVKANTSNAKYRLRARKYNGSTFTNLADNIPSGFSETTLSGNFPSPVSDFIDSSGGNAMALEIRCASSNRFAGFFRHSTDLVEWKLTP